MSKAEIIESLVNEAIQEGYADHDYAWYYVGEETAELIIRDALHKLQKHLAQTEKEYIQILEKLLTERERVLHAIPPCPDHGEDCVPHAIEWIEARIDS